MDSASTSGPGNIPDGARRASGGRAGDDLWTVLRALDWTRGYLETKGDEHPRLSAEWLLSAATGLSRVELYAFGDRPLSMPERDKLRESVRRRASGEPLQYVTGEMAFRHIVVSVEPGVLIPRPETEMLVDLALEHVDPVIERKGSARVLDIGTGSGCIALSFLHERESVTCTATDISDAAIACARRNADALGLADRLTLVECDLADGISSDAAPFDAVVSNPPYIPTAEVDTLSREIVGFEPRIALDGGPDGLDVFRRILGVLPRLLARGGIFVCELHEEHLEEALELCRRPGALMVSGEGCSFAQTRIVCDLAGRNRFLVASNS